jgi:hypothetical protein
MRRAPFSDNDSCCASFDVLNQRMSGAICEISATNHTIQIYLPGTTLKPLGCARLSHEQIQKHITHRQHFASKLQFLVQGRVGPALDDLSWHGLGDKSVSKDVVTLSLGGCCWSGIGKNAW